MIPKFVPSEWELREQALPPCAVLALGELHQARLTAWLHANAVEASHFDQLCFNFPDAQAGELPGRLLWLSTDGLRAKSVLPWFDGVLYVGAEQSCPQLWLPCSQAPRLPAQWLHAAAQRRTRAHRHLLWPAPALLVALP